MNKGENMKLSANFWLDEFEKSQTATRHGIDNSVPSGLVNDIKDLCVNVLQPIRDEFGPVTITSGYRSPDLNAKLGGSTRSQHCAGQAADLEVPGVDNRRVALWIQDNLKFDQLILEGYKPYVTNSGWIHVSYRPFGLRNQVLTATFSGGKARYTNGIV